MFACLDLLFSSTPLEGPEQMALDEVLLKQLQKPLLRIYCWKAPCVTFGFFQKIETVQAAFPGHSLVRRWSGGGCVEHGEDMTFSLIVPASEPAGTMAPSLFYEELHKAMLASLQKAGLAARLTTPQEEQEGAACFQAPRLHDLLLGDQKIMGGAQRRCAGSLLYQGSLQIGRWEVGDRRLEMEGGRQRLEDVKCEVGDRRREAEGERLEMEDRREKGSDQNDMARTLFSSLAAQLSPTVHLIEEEKQWLTAAAYLGEKRYRSKAWMAKR